MIEKVFFNKWAQDRYRAGPVSSHADSFAAFMLERGHSVENVRSQFGLIRDINTWLIREQKVLKAFNDPENKSKFLKFRRRRVSRLTFKRDRYAFHLFLEHLTTNCVLNPPKLKPLSKIERLLRRYSEYLEKERGITELSNRRYCGLNQEFLNWRFPDGELDLRAIAPKDVYDFTLSHSRRVSPKTAALAVSSLRSFLNFFFLNGKTSSNLAEHVPTIPNRKNSDIPRYLEPNEIRTIVNSCNRSTKMGKRDYAILLTLARLGIRAVEVRRLKLDDIDWPGGMIIFHGKGKRMNRFPLPKDVGAAIVDYIKTARPKSSCRHVFLRTRAPIKEITDSASISTIVHRAIKRTKLRPPFCGAHIFRHSLGTQALRSGASLREVARLLGQTELNTAAIYAKVDFKGLSQVARPWPDVSAGGTK